MFLMKIKNNYNPENKSEQKITTEYKTYKY